MWKSAGRRRPTLHVNWVNAETHEMFAHRDIECAYAASVIYLAVPPERVQDVCDALDRGEAPPLDFPLYTAPARDPSPPVRLL